MKKILLTKNIKIACSILLVLVAILVILFNFRTTILCGSGGDDFYYRSIASSKNNLFAIEKQNITTQVLYLTDFKGNEKIISEKVRSRPGFPYNCEEATKKDFNPRFSSDGSSLYYSTIIESGSPDPDLELHKYSVKDDADEIVLTKSTDTYEFENTVSWDSSVYNYEINGETYFCSSDIEVFVGVSEKRCKKLTSIVDEFKDTSRDSITDEFIPSVSADGKTLVYTAVESSGVSEESTGHGKIKHLNRAGPDKLGILNLGTKNISLIGVSDLSNAYYPFYSKPQISPDGKYVIWVQEPSSESGDPYVRVLDYFEIFRLDLQTNEIKQLTNLKSAIRESIFIDDKTIVFLKDSDYKLEDQYYIRADEIWAVDIDGSNPRRLSSITN
jgi:hypothetical protein